MPAKGVIDTKPTAHNDGALPSAPVSAHGVTITGVSKSFGPVDALAEVSLQAAPNEVVAIVGPSGCGKSTLLEIVCGLQAQDSGEVKSDPAVLMPQRDLLLPWFSALDNAALALHIAGYSRSEAKARAHEHFLTFGLEGFEETRPADLSGGMRQRVAFLRTLLSGKPVLCLDEPFGALDALTRFQMQNWLADALQKKPRTVLLVTHDVEEALLLGDRVVLLTERPGHTLREFVIEIPRPRERDNEELITLRTEIFELLLGGI